MGPIPQGRFRGSIYPVVALGLERVLEEDTSTMRVGQKEGGTFR